MKLIVDVSVALPWNVTSQATPLTENAADRVREHGALVPFHFHMEFGNALLVLERRGKLKSREADRALDNLSLLNVEVDDLPVHDTEPTLFALARRHRLTLYDAAYLELASRTGLPLATRDAALAKATKSAGALLFQG